MDTIILIGYPSNPSDTRLSGSNDIGSLIKYGTITNRIHTDTSGAMANVTPVAVSGLPSCGVSHSVNLWVPAQTYGAWSNVSLQYASKLLTLGYPRLAFGFRLVFTDTVPTIALSRGEILFGITKTNAGTPLSTTIYGEAPVDIFNADPRGIYVEALIDFTNGLIDYYIDGVKISTINVRDSIVKTISGTLSIGIRAFKYANTGITYTVKGYVKDLYVGGLSPSTVFSPLGDLTVSQLPVLDSGNGTITAASINTLAAAMDTAVSSSTSYTETYNQPTGLSTADVVTAIVPSITAGTVQMKSASTDIGVQMLSEPNIFSIEPSSIGTDITTVFTAT